MNFQLTLVDAHSPAPSEENIMLTFDRDDMRNTTLHACGANLPSYFVVTLDSATTNFGVGNCLGSTNLRSWLKAPIFSSFPLEFRACGRRFKWEEDLAQQLVLRESRRLGDTLAWFSKSCGGHPIHAPCLFIKPELAPMRDMVVLSFLLAEHKRRVLITERGPGKTILDTMAIGF